MGCLPYLEVLLNVRVCHAPHYMQTQGSNLFLLFGFNLDNQPGRSKWSYQKLTATEIAKIHAKTQNLMTEKDGWNAIFCENHDALRSILRFADDSDKWRDYAAKMLCTKHTMLGGTECIY